jgi:MFS family permease
MRPMSAFARFVAGRTAGVLARQLVGVTVSWEVYARTRSAWALGLIGLVQVVPVMLLAVPAGVLVDRWGRRASALLAQGVAGLAMLALAMASWLSLPLEASFAALFVLGAAVALLSPASSALLPQLVERAQLARANAIGSTCAELASVLGPALGGALIALSGGPVLSYGVAVVGALAFWLALLSVRPKPVPALAATPGAWSSGVRYVFRSKFLFPAMVLDMFAVLFAGVTALLPVFADDVLKVGPAGLGWLRAAPSLGAFLMALVATRLPPWQHSGRVLLTVVALFGVITVAFGLSTSFPLSLGLLFLAGAVDNVSVVIRITLEQMATPDALRGRVSAVHYIFIGISNELGELESGVAAGLLGTVPAVVLGGLATLGVVALVAFAFPSLRNLGPLTTVRPDDVPA